ncbi:hypothetical protein MIND_00880200 [Mycena indigotica]|uniref:Uncharacterized protein n=1 Tax=Mycena indigotica TaxID=2126181 RepID=A0A8H6VZC1_9AGAR|nr:uncharacterized protein MIND_00880200 [Mycena indigotica]KAF7299312.1 hypothetical protein MIND_00880200 [Mycena indigotica]
MERHCQMPAAPSIQTPVPNPVMASNERLKQILAAYPAAITDFFGSGTLCLFKSGPPWPVAQGQASNLVRAARPIYDMEKAETWLETAKLIVMRLDALELKMQLTAVDPLAYANTGDEKLICNFVVVISVKPNSLAQGDAAGIVTPTVLSVLMQRGFSNAQVAVVEADHHRQAKFMPFDPNNELESTAILRKPFTFTPGLSIAPHATPYYEGTGGVFLRLSTGTDDNDKRVYLLTCAHIARPPVQFENVAYTLKNTSQPLEKFVLHGTESCSDAIGNIMKLIGDETKGIAAWQSSLDRLPAYAQGEPASRTNRRAELAGRIDAAKTRITAANKLHDAITKNYTFLDSRIFKFGHLYHCAKIEVGDDGYMYDWALIEVHKDRLEAGLFQGNKLYVGGNMTAVDWENYMFPQPHDRQDFHVPEDLLLQIEDYVCEDDFRSPRNRDVNDGDTLLAVKNGRTTGTTFGRVNGLESINRYYEGHDLTFDATEMIILGYDIKTGKNDHFSDGGEIRSCRQAWSPYWAPHGRQRSNQRH